MANLYDETINMLKINGKSLEDIKSVQCDDFAITLENFIEVAKNTDYDGGYGAQEVAIDLKIIGEDWWMERREYDGAEWWEFRKAPEINKEIKQVKKLAGGYWQTLKGINEE